MAAGGLFAAPFVVEAQQARVYRVGVVLQGGPYSEAIEGLREGLRELGPEEGKQIILQVRDAKGDLKAVEAAAPELEPIVFHAGADPVAQGSPRREDPPGRRAQDVVDDTPAGSRRSGGRA